MPVYLIGRTRNGRTFDKPHRRRPDFFAPAIRKTDGAIHFREVFRGGLVLLSHADNFLICISRCSGDYFYFQVGHFSKQADVQENFPSGPGTARPAA
jgi:hypothetical protein